MITKWIGRTFPSTFFKIIHDRLNVSYNGREYDFLSFSRWIYLIWTIFSSPYSLLFAELNINKNIYIIFFFVEKITLEKKKQEMWWHKCVCINEWKLICWTFHMTSETALEIDLKEKPHEYAKNPTKNFKSSGWKIFTFECSRDVTFHLN